MIRSLLRPSSCRKFQKLVFQNHQQVRLRSKLPVNLGINFVPQQEAWIVERFGKFNKVLEPGLNFLLPFVDQIKYVQVLKELAIAVPHQSAITLDNVSLMMDAVLYLKIINPYKASYGIEDPEYAITQLAQTTMRSEIGKIQLDGVFRERESLNTNIVLSMNKASLDAWGIDCLRYEIRDVKIPDRVQEAMQMQVEAERKKRASILQSEGIREAEINVAQGKKQARILNSEANKTEQINTAVGEAEALIAKANGKAKSIDIISSSLSQQNGANAVAYNIAEQYVGAFGNVAKQGNTLILPSNAGDVTNMVGQALAIYKNLSTNQSSSDIIEQIPETSDIIQQSPNSLKSDSTSGSKSDSKYSEEDLPSSPTTSNTDKND